MLRSLVLKAAFLAVTSCTAFAQADSVIITKSADFSYHKISLFKNSYGTGINVREIRYAGNISTAVFLNGDSLVLIEKGSTPVRASLNNIDMVTMKTGNKSLAIGIIPGVMSGVLAGLGVVALLNLDPQPDFVFSREDKKTFYYSLGGLIGAVAGGLIGAMIINNINHETLNLYSVKDKDKKTKLIKFLRQK